MPKNNAKSSPGQDKPMSTFMKGFTESMKDSPEDVKYTFKPQRLDGKTVDLMSRLLAAADNPNNGLAKLLDSFLAAAINPRDRDVLMAIPDAKVAEYRDMIFSVTRTRKAAKQARARTAPVRGAALPRGTGPAGSTDSQPD
jgi:hypothetical protein